MISSYRVDGRICRIFVMRVIRFKVRGLLLLLILNANLVYYFIFFIVTGVGDLYTNFKLSLWWILKYFSKKIKHDNYLSAHCVCGPLFLVEAQLEHGWSRHKGHSPQTVTAANNSATRSKMEIRRRLGACSATQHFSVLLPITYR